MMLIKQSQAFGNRQWSWQLRIFFSAALCILQVSKLSHVSSASAWLKLLLESQLLIKELAKIHHLERELVMDIYCYLANIRYNDDTIREGYIFYSLAWAFFCRLSS